MLVAGVKSEAPGDSLDTLVADCVTLFENEPETNKSWDTEEVVPPTLPFGLKLVLVCTRLKAGGTLGPFVFTRPNMDGGPLQADSESVSCLRCKFVGGWCEGHRVSPERAVVSPLVRYPSNNVY